VGSNSATWWHLNIYSFYLDYVKLTTLVFDSDRGSIKHNFIYRNVTASLLWALKIFILFPIKEKCPSLFLPNMLGCISWNFYKLWI
jgi:hypothetical protein